MIINTESNLLNAIEEFTKANQKMPTKIKGSFNDLLPIYSFRGYTSYFVGMSCIFITHLGCLQLTLDANAPEPYLE